MKRTVCLMSLTLALPMVARANSIDFTHGQVTVTGSSAGVSGMPNRVIFSGSFTGPVTWGLIALADGTHNCTLTAALTGTWFTGQKVNRAVIQLTSNMGKGCFNGSTTLSSGDTSTIGSGLVIVTPEPASMVFFGTGLVGLAGIVRRKSKR